MLLCIKWHSNFDRLKRYVDVVDDKLVVKVVKNSVLPNDEKHREWEMLVGKLKNDRIYMKQYLLDGWQAVEPNGEMTLYFIGTTTAKLSNRKALEFHKAACLIWRMAGGAESEDEYCPDDDYIHPVPVDKQAKEIMKWADSSATLTIENIQ